MASHLTYSVDASAKLAALDPWIRRAVEKTCDSIKDRPAAMTKGSSRGVRFWRGMQLEDSQTCYLTIAFDFLATIDTVNIIDVDGYPCAGPH